MATLENSATILLVAIDLQHIFNWVSEYWLWILFSIFLVLAILVGVANYRLPDRSKVTASFYLDEKLGENNRLWQLLSKFSHTKDQTYNKIDDDQSTLHRNNLSGIYTIDDGHEALNIRVLLTQIAEHSLDLQYYMWHDDASGRLLFYEVWQAAERGVRVRLLLDDNNTVGMDSVLQTLNNHHNIEVRLFNPFMNRRFRMLGYLTALRRLNRRMHNKSFTIDNQASIFGGRNIGDEYFDINEKVNFADLDVLAIGNVVNEISADFDRYWNSEACFPFDYIVKRNLTKVDLSKANHKSYTTQTAQYRNALAESGFLDELEQGSLSFLWVNVKFVSDSPTKALPDSLLQKTRHAFGSLSSEQKNNEVTKKSNLIEQISSTLLSPKKSLTIVSPYFVPSKRWTKKFVELAYRGIDLNILTNSLTATDVLAVHAGYIRYRKPLLQGNVRLFELKSRRHSKNGEHVSFGQSRYQNSRQNRHYRKQHRDRHRWINRSTASLHAKTFSVDGELLFVGSFNFDPRSAAINTELGAIIESPILAAQLDDMIDKWKKDLAYVVSIDDEKLLWADNSLDPSKVFNNEPESSWRQRIIVWLIGKLPIEDFL